MKITDFSIAKLMGGDEPRLALTQDQQVIGAPHCMADARSRRSGGDLGPKVGARRYLWSQPIPNCLTVEAPILARDPQADRKLIDLTDY